jgi:hypothetical protein
MSRFVLDASATLAWCFQDESVAAYAPVSAVKSSYVVR